ncbi:hypothetical protein AK812_SmicGene40956 [Symbiodinium microadriaticum]|uniref:Uncharacterized protein n=1 Tax=Symbiodinium microadriaticum TaxID=2951 RepID=A0A1Q9C7D5_SYMMI|nr:hypothetical protein AK812_SmicGene40956 [Symbiodinium microadriaticum]
MATGGCWWDRKLSRADWHNFGLVVKRTGTRLPRTRGLKGSTCGIDRYGNSQYGPLGYFNMNHNHKPMLERHDQRPRLAPTERSMWVNRDADISALGLPRSGYDRRQQGVDRSSLVASAGIPTFRCILYVWTAPDVKFGTSQTRQVLEELANVKMNSTQEPAMMSKDLLGLSDFIAGPERAVLPTLYMQKVTTEQAAGQQEQMMLTFCQRLQSGAEVRGLQKEAINIPTSEGRTLGRGSQTDLYLDFQMFESNAPFLADLLRRRIAMKGVGAVCAVQPGCCHKSRVHADSEARVATTAPAVFAID